MYKIFMLSRLHRQPSENMKSYRGGMYFHGCNINAWLIYGRAVWDAPHVVMPSGMQRVETRRGGLIVKSWLQ